MCSRDVDFEYDAIVFHSEDEISAARKFCNVVKANVNLNRPLEIITFNDFGNPGKSVIQILEDALTAARFIFCSEYHYHTDPFGAFAGQVAIMGKLPDKLVKVSTGRTVGNTSVMRAFKGIELQENWEVSEQVLEKLRKLFSSTLDEAKNHTTNRNSDQSTALSELTLEEPLSELSIESCLEVENPSLSTASYRAEDSAPDEKETEHGAYSPRLQRSVLWPQEAVTRTQTSKSGDTIVGSAALPGDDLEEDSETVVVTRTDNTGMPETSGIAQMVSSHPPPRLTRRLVSRSMSADDSVSTPLSASAQEDRPIPVLKLLYYIAALFFVLLSTFYILQSKTM